jgi:hypothetical protein
MADYFQTDEEIAAVVDGFEQCSTGKDGFSHICHLTVATYYLFDSTPDEAFQKMRVGLLRFLDHHGVGREHYKDRLTWAWIEQIQSVIEQMDSEASLVAITNAVVERLSDSRIVLEAQPEDGAVKT